MHTTTNTRKFVSARRELAKLPKYYIFETTETVPFGLVIRYPGGGGGMVIGRSADSNVRGLSNQEAAPVSGEALRCVRVKL